MSLLILLLDLDGFFMCISSDLVHRLGVISLHGNDVLFEMGDLILFLSNRILMVLLLLVDLLSVLLVDGSLGISELSGLLLLLFLKGLVPGCVFKHPL